jgi:poly-gamma-glutamate system protein
MRRRQGRVNRWVLVALAVLSLFLFFVVTRSVRMVKSRLYEEKLASARLSEQAFRVVREMRLQLGFPIDSVNDPNVSGLVGQQYSQTSYGRGDLSDELTTIDPNFSAAIVEMLHRAGVRRGDSIGVSWDGSYPALNIQLLAVAKTMNLRPAIVTAQSATAWGADYPGFTWLDIERRLAGSGLWTYRSKCATLGGADDLGQGLSPAGRAILTAAAESAGVELCPRLPDSAVRENGIRAGVALRVAAFAGVKAFVSIGKSVADIGDPLARVPSRVMSGRIDSRGKSGVVGAMLQRGVPVLRIGNPSQVAIDYHLPLSPVPMPEPGKGRLFHERRYSVVLSAVFAAILLGLLALVVRYDVEWYLGVREESGEKEAV